MQEESCIAGHLGERAPKTADEDAANGAAAEEAADDAVDVPEDADDGHSGDYSHASTKGLVKELLCFEFWYSLMCCLCQANPQSKISHGMSQCR